LRGKAQAAGLQNHIDEAGNVCLRLGGRQDDAPCVMTGSHIDSVPGGGHLDGALGVVAGLECLRVLRENGARNRRPLEALAFADEEGRFGGMLGSQALVGALTPQAILEARDLDGVSLSEAMKQHGLDALGALRAARRKDSVHAFVELHIEQGPVLDRARVPIGVVQGIVGLRRWSARLIGASNHAGTTPMDARRDAFHGLAEIALCIPAVVQEAGGPHAVATIGRVELQPGAANVIPGRAEFSVDIRDITREGLDSLSAALREMMGKVARKRDLMFEFELVSQLEPELCNSEIQQLIRSEAERLGSKTHSLPSGAAHDTQMLAKLTRVGMIFVPSRGGRSHSAAEWTAWEDIELGTTVLLRTLARLAEQA
jgi:N-carbamoyl-L-amino-acid hydrolase